MNAHKAAIFVRTIFWSVFAAFVAIALAIATPAAAHQTEICNNKFNFWYKGAKARADLYHEWTLKLEAARKAYMEERERSKALLKEHDAREGKETKTMFESVPNRHLFRLERMLLQPAIHLETIKPDPTIEARK
jgi:hypothetical protein